MALEQRQVSVVTSAPEERWCPTSCRTAYFKPAGNSRGLKASSVLLFPINTTSITSHLIMVKVAIAGGSGGLGRVITEAIIATGKHEVFVISRSVSEICPLDVEPTNLGWVSR